MSISSNFVFKNNERYIVLFMHTLELSQYIATHCLSSMQLRFVTVH